MKIMVFQYLGGSRIVHFTFFLGEASEEVSRGDFIVIFDALGLHLGALWGTLGPLLLSIWDQIRGHFAGLVQKGVLGGPGEPFGSYFGSVSM